jgi:hypothetical protein
MPVSPLFHAPPAHLGKIPHGQPSPFPSAPVNGRSSALYSIEGGSVSQMTPNYTQWPSDFAFEPHSITASVAFGEQSRALGAYEPLNNGYSQTE